MVVNKPPYNYMLPAILSCIFCCWPLGLRAIIAASNVSRYIYICVCFGEGGLGLWFITSHDIFPEKPLSKANSLNR